jgi:hypothetical protein
MRHRVIYFHACFATDLTRKSTTQSYRTPIYYVDLTLRDGVNLQEAISSAKQIDEQSKAAGFYQEALDQARQGYGNASFEVGGEGLDIVEEFYSDQQNAVDTQPDHAANTCQTVDSAMQIQNRVLKR